MPSPFTLGTRAKSPVVSTVSRNPALAFCRGHEGEDSRRPLLWARGRSPVVFTVSRRTVGTRAKIPVVSTVSRNPTLAFHRGDEGEDSRRPLPWARGRRFLSPFTVGPRLMSPVALYRGHEGEDSRRLYREQESRARL